MWLKFSKKDLQKIRDILTQGQFSFEHVGDLISEETDEYFCIVIAYEIGLELMNELDKAQIEYKYQ